MQSKKWNDDVPFDLLKKLTMSEIRFALQHYTNKRYDKRKILGRADGIQLNLWNILTRLEEIEDEQDEQYPQATNEGDAL